MQAALVIPVLNEEASIGAVLDEVPQAWFCAVIVADNGSTDRTAEEAAARGARITVEPRRGYGGACLKALQALPAEAEVVVFMDGDGSDDPREADRLLRPIRENRADLVLGSRVLGPPQRGALHVHQRFGNWIATRLVRLLLGHGYTDLGPFRAIRADSLRTRAARAAAGPAPVTPIEGPRLRMDSRDADPGSPTRLACGRGASLAKAADVGREQGERLVARELRCRLQDPVDRLAWRDGVAEMSLAPSP